MSQNVEIYADLPGHNVSGQSIPQDILVTASLPNLVIVDSSTPVKTVYLFELTVCFERADNIQAAYQRKYDRYASLAVDIEDRGYSCRNILFAIDCKDT